MSDHSIDIATDVSTVSTTIVHSEPITPRQSKSVISTPRRSVRVVERQEKKIRRVHPYDSPTPAPKTPARKRAATSRRADPQPGGSATPKPRAEASPSSSMSTVSLGAEINAVLLLSGRLQPTPAEREQVEYELRASRQHSRSALRATRKRTPHGAFNVRNAAAPYTVPSRPRQRTPVTESAILYDSVAGLARLSPMTHKLGSTRHATVGAPRTLPPVSALLLPTDEDTFIPRPVQPQFELPSSPFFPHHLQLVNEDARVVEHHPRDHVVNDTLPRTPALSPVLSVSSVSFSPGMPRTPNSSVSSSAAGGKMLLLADAALQDRVTCAKAGQATDSGVGLGLQLHMHDNTYH